MVKVGMPETLYNDLRPDTRSVAHGDPNDRPGSVVHEDKVPEFARANKLLNLLAPADGPFCRQLSLRDLGGGTLAKASAFDIRGMLFEHDNQSSNSNSKPRISLNGDADSPKAK
jgi:hypothetical protein